MNGTRFPLPPRFTPAATVEGNRSGDDDDHVRRFLALCLVEAQRYGDDDDVWVRELVQNARDAGARTIRFMIDRGVVVVEDDGSGMSRAVLAGQLLRLFSSSKGVDQGQAAGCFGVGFWSVLRAQPRQIVVDTNDGAEACGVLVDVEGAAVVERDQHARDGRRRRGTTVRLFGTRLATAVDAEAQVRRAILRQASTVRGLRGQAPPTILLVTATGHEKLNAPIDLAGVDGVLVSTAVSGPGFRGVVGLSNRPLVELFHHGLRVVSATTLAAVVPSLPMPTLHGFGLAIRVDVDDLRVLVDRRTVVEDDLVRAVVAACHDAGARLERRVLDGVAPLPRWRRIMELLSRRGIWQATLSALGAVLVGLVGGALGLSLLFPDELDGLRRSWRTPPQVEVRPTAATPPPPTTTAAPVATSTPRSLTEAIDQLGAPRIDPRGSDQRGLDLATRRVVHDNLTLQVVTIPDDARGLVPRPVRERARGDGIRRGAAVASARFTTTDRVVLPSSQVLWPVEALVDGVKTPIALTDDGLPLLALSPGAARTVDVAFAMNDGAAPERVAAPPVVVVPALEPLAALARGRPRVEGIGAVAAAVRARVRYSADLDDARRFGTDRRSLVDKALALGVGDCDVINTVLVRALQQAGLEARLAVGVIVRDDVVAAELHAWVEVIGDDGSWLVVDASPPDAVPVPGRGSTLGTVTSPFVLASMAAAPETTTTAPAAASSASTPSATTTDPVPWRAIGAVVFALVVALIVRRRTPRRLDPVADDDVTALIVAGLHSGAAEHLGLWQRPILPTSHGVIDLRAARHLAHRGRLAVGVRTSWLDRSVRLLDPLDRRVRALRPFLPAHPAVDDVGAIAVRGQRWRALQARIDRLLDGVVLHAADDGDGIREVLLCTRDGAEHHVLIGRALEGVDDDTVWRRLLDDASSLRALRDQR